MGQHPITRKKHTLINLDKGSEKRTVYLINDIKLVISYVKDKSSILWSKYSLGVYLLKFCLHFLCTKCCEYFWNFRYLMNGGNIWRLKFLTCTCERELCLHLKYQTFDVYYSCCVVNKIDNYKNFIVSNVSMKPHMSPTCSEQYYYYYYYYCLILNIQY